MALYPSLPVIKGDSTQLPVDDLTVDEWPDGSVRGQSFFTPGRYKWSLVHKLPADSDLATLLAFYNANKLLDTISFLSPWDGVTYTGIVFMGVPDYVLAVEGFYKATVLLRQA